MYFVLGRSFIVFIVFYAEILFCFCFLLYTLWRDVDFCSTITWERKKVGSGSNEGAEGSRNKLDIFNHFNVQQTFNFVDCLLLAMSFVTGTRNPQRSQLALNLLWGWARSQPDMEPHLLLLWAVYELGSNLLYLFGGFLVRPYQSLMSSESNNNSINSGPDGTTFPFLCYYLARNTTSTDDILIIAKSRQDGNCFLVASARNKRNSRHFDLIAGNNHNFYVALSDSDCA